MRERILFDNCWKFHRGDIHCKAPVVKGPMYIQAKTERALYGPAARAYNDDSDSYSLDKEIQTEYWETVRLPHDYVVLQTPDEHENCALGYFMYENAWYRKHFRLTEEDRKKRLSLFFEGVATRATVYLNGCLLGHNFCGYTSFAFDITDYVDFENDNVLAVYVDTTEHESWWYEGGGIYRHVWLEKTDPIAVDRYGIYVIPAFQGDGMWSVSVENTVRNDSEEDTFVGIHTELSDDKGIILSLNGSFSVAAHGTNMLRLTGKVENPTLWSPENPHQYCAITTLTVGDAETDSETVNFGFRYYTFDENGMKLNGLPTVIKGVCMHGDFGLTGKAVPDNICRYKISLLKEMGANGLRCSHYPHAEATMDALDEMGFITMAETRWFDSSKEGLEQLEMLIKRDRNRPSVLFWSIGNEENKFVTDSGRRIARTMAAFIRRLDNTRLIIAANDKSPVNGTIYESLDAIGVNYNLDSLDAVHEKYPGKPFVSSENAAAGTTRGWYYDDAPEKGYLNAIDHDTVTWSRCREKTWRFLRERPWIIGGYQWSGMEYRGECNWPRLCSSSGAIDLFLQKKDAFYQNQSFWIEDRPILHLLPHWNHFGMEGELIRVVAYTNCDSAELYLNGESLGMVSVAPISHAEWLVPYTPGVLECIGYRNGKEVIRDRQMSTGPAAILSLVANVIPDEADGNNILLATCFCLDGDGNRVPDASPLVRFVTNRNGTVIATGSDISDHVPVSATERRMYAGAISIAVRPCHGGTIVLYAEADGLKTASLKVVIP